MFETANIPNTIVGNGSLDKALLKANSFGDKGLVILSKYFYNLEDFKNRVQNIIGKDTFLEFCPISGEPNPYDVDQIAKQTRILGIKFIVAIGGGSVIDFAKALSGILPIKDGTVFDYLEVVGNGKKYDAIPTPLIAIPSTPGTGAEVTKNSVLSVPGEFKKSFRDDKLIPNIVALDPSLLRSIPKDILAATAMDGLTQIIESYTSINDNLFVDTLIESILPNIFTTIKKIKTDDLDSDDYLQLSLMGYYSGIALANCGLGIIHSFASSIGAYTTAPHGVVCARLLPICTQKNIEWMKKNNIDTKKYERFGEFSLGKESSLETLTKELFNLLYYLEIKKLSSYGLEQQLIEKIVDQTAIKTNPANLEKNILTNILESEIQTIL
jgi:alcohol dehydrogenase class IV